jgi:hypothetical protein
MYSEAIELHAKEKESRMNMYTFFSGIFLIILSASHVIYGIRAVFRDVFLLDIPEHVKTSLFIPWHELTFILFALGIAQIVVAYRKSLKSISVLILIILFGYEALFFMLSYARKDWFVLSSSIPQQVLIGILIILTIIGILKQHRD